MATSDKAILGEIICENVARATVYRMCSIGWTKSEESAVYVSLKAYAQFPRAVRLQGKERGKRSTSAHIFHDGQAIIVLDGWGHPDVIRPTVAEAWGENDAGFPATLDAYVAKTGARVLADLRNHNPRSHA